MAALVGAGFIVGGLPKRLRPVCAEARVGRTAANVAARTRVRAVMRTPVVYSRDSNGRKFIPPAAPLVDLMGKVAIVTGAARGLGRAAAQRLYALGASVAVNVR